MKQSTIPPFKRRTAACATACALTCALAHLSHGNTAYSAPSPAPLPEFRSKSEPQPEHPTKRTFAAVRPLHLEGGSSVTAERNTKRPNGPGFGFEVVARLPNHARSDEIILLDATGPVALGRAARLVTQGLAIELTPALVLQDLLHLRVRVWTQDAGAKRWSPFSEGLFKTAPSGVTQLVMGGITGGRSVDVMLKISPPAGSRFRFPGSGNGDGMGDWRHQPPAPRGPRGVTPAGTIFMPEPKHSGTPRVS